MKFIPVFIFLSVFFNPALAYQVTDGERVLKQTAPEVAANNAEETLRDVQSILMALKMYRLDKGAYPTSEEGLNPLVGTYLTSWPKDHWGRKYLYSNEQHIVEIRSNGADNKLGGVGDNKDIILQLFERMKPSL